MSTNYVVDLIRSKLDSEHSITDYYRQLPLIIQYYLLKSLYYVDSVILAKPFTKHGWLLAINTVLSTWRGSKLIVYYNEREPRYTASLIIQELVSKALINEYSNILSDNKTLLKTLSYLASFVSGFRDLYREEVVNYVTQLCRDRFVVSVKYFNFFKHDLMYVVIPRIIAYKLVGYDYKSIVEESISNYKKIYEMWMSTNPDNTWIIALSNALKIVGYNPLDYYLIETNPVVVKTNHDQKYVFIYINEVDEKYIEMMRLLKKAVEKRDRAEEILKEWWSDLSQLDEIELIKQGLIIPDIFLID